MSGIGRGANLWFSQFPTLGGLNVDGRITSTPHNPNARARRNVCDSACSTADVGVDSQSAPPGRDVGHVPVTVLSDLVKQIGTSIGENIASCLKSIPTGGVNTTQSATADISKVNLTVSHDSYEPHPFRGDNTDKISVSEWEDAMRLYLSRRGIELCDQVEEVFEQAKGEST